MAELQQLKQRNLELSKEIQIKELKIHLATLTERNKALQNLLHQTQSKLVIKTAESKRLASELIHLKLSKPPKPQNILSKEQLYRIVNNVHVLQKNRREKQKLTATIQNKRGEGRILKEEMEEEVTRDDILRMEGVSARVMEEVERRCDECLGNDGELKGVLLGYIRKGGSEEGLVRNSQRLFEELGEYLGRREERVKEIVREFVERGCELVLGMGLEEVSS